MDRVNLDITIRQAYLDHYKALLSLGLEQETPIKPLADAIIKLQLQLNNAAPTLMTIGSKLSCGNDREEAWTLFTGEVPNHTPL